MKYLISLAVAILSAVASGDVATFGPVGDRLTAADLSALAGLARSPRLLAIEAHRDMALPEAWLAFAYLSPESEHGAIRRGRVLDCKAVLAGGAPVGWRVTSRDGRYAQVAVAGRPFGAAIGDRDLDRPFRVLGRFSDAQILEIVTYVRSSPRKPPIPDRADGVSIVELDQVEGDLPLVQLARVGRTDAEVWLASSAGTGQHVVLHRRDGRWQVGDIADYIS